MDQIDLANCHVTQNTKDGKKSDWIVKRKDGEELATLPKDLNEKQVMKAIHFARKFELIAFNKGIQFKKSVKTEMVPDERKKLHAVIAGLEKHNSVLAEKLDNFIGE